MGVAIPQPAIHAPHTALRTGVVVWGRADARNLCLVLAGLALVLLLIPPLRAYPMSDDWAYTQSLQRLLDLTYRPHDWTQPIALGHLVWGVPFALLFGLNFTALTVATLVISALCLLVFYALLRHLNVAPTPALIGTALLGLTPMYLYLTYTFMTDITFMLYVLTACLCFVRWAQGRGDRWLLLGSLGVALAYLTRQHGIVLLPAMLAYLWWARRLNWRTVLMLCAVPALAALAYMLWERTQPTPMVTHLVGMTLQEVAANPLLFVWAQMQRSVLVLVLPGLCLLPLAVYFKPRKALAAVPIFLFFVFFLVRSLTVYGTAFPAFGSLVDNGGLVMYDYDKAPIWSEQVWMLVGIAGASVISLYIAGVAGEVWSWWRGGRKAKGPELAKEARRNGDPAFIVYATGVLLAMLTFASPYLFDRYVLPILPMMMLYPLRKMSSHDDRVQEPEQDHVSRTPSHANPAFVAALILPMALFSLLAMRDYKAHSEARWEAAEGLVAGGVQRERVNGGYEWLSWFLFEEGIARMRALNDPSLAGQPYQAVLDPTYLVGEWTHKEYRQIGSVPYDCWLCGGATRSVLVQERQSR